jgi:hypothetical protein
VAKISLEVMSRAKVPKRFKAASLRHAAACAALAAGVPIDEVLKIGRWRSRDVFEKFYWVASGSGNIVSRLI